MTLKRFMLYWAFAGFFIPMAILLINYYGPWEVIRLLYHLWFFLWPSSFMTASLQGALPSNLPELAITAYSIGINVCLYAGLGGTVFKVYLWLARSGGSEDPPQQA